MIIDTAFRQRVAERGVEQNLIEYVLRAGGRHVCRIKMVVFGKFLSDFLFWIIVEVNSVRPYLFFSVYFNRHRGLFSYVEPNDSVFINQINTFDGQYLSVVVIFNQIVPGMRGDAADNRHGQIPAVNL